MDINLIANSGIQFFSFRLSINTQDRFKEWFHEWYDTDNGEWKLELVTQVNTDDCTVYYRKADLINGGFLADPDAELSVDELRHDGILPICIDDEMCDGVKGEIFPMTLTDRHNKLAAFENEWLPGPYLFNKTPKRFKVGPLN